MVFSATTLLLWAIGLVQVDARTEAMAKRIGQPLPIKSLDGKPVDETATQRQRELGRVRSPGSPARLTPIDGPFADRNPLGTSLRMPSVDPAASPIGFLRTYRVEGVPDRVVRANGGLYAISPYSVYARGKQGLKAQIPPSTVFSIGMPLTWTAEPNGRAAPSNGSARTVAQGPIAPVPIDRRIDGRAESRRFDDPAARSPAAPMAVGLYRFDDPQAGLARSRDLPPIVGSETYRRLFYRQFIAAAEAGAAE